MPASHFPHPVVAIARAEPSGRNRLDSRPAIKHPWTRPAVRGAHRAGPAASVALAGDPTPLRSQGGPTHDHHDEQQSGTCHRAHRPGRRRLHRTPQHGRRCHRRGPRPRGRDQPFHRREGPHRPRERRSGHSHPRRQRPAAASPPTSGVPAGPAPQPRPSPTAPTPARLRQAAAPAGATGRPPSGSSPSPAGTSAASRHCARSTR